MKVRFNLARIKQTKWHEYAIRFVFGGAITAVAGFLSHQYGPKVGGLFLAFPAILPASMTLVQRHQGRLAAWVDTVGAAIGSIGLLGFAFVVWELAPRISGWEVLLSASLLWFTISAGIWIARQKARQTRLVHPSKSFRSPSGSHIMNR